MAAGNVTDNDIWSSECDPLSVVLVTPPANAALTLAPDGSYTLTPDDVCPDGSYLFEYQLVGSCGTSNVAFEEVIYTLPANVLTCPISGEPLTACDECLAGAC